MKQYKLILSSNSPRRKELLAGLGIPFTVHVIKGIDESYPRSLKADDIPLYLSRKKAAAYESTMASDEIIITADTVVVCDGEVLGKPQNRQDAQRMLMLISGKTHRVITGVTIKTQESEKSFSVVTEVTFKNLSAAEIEYYIDTFKPFDKAGAYGIQEWIGYIGVTEIRGSYFNVMGLPVQRIYEELKLYFGLSQ